MSLLKVKFAFFQIKTHFPTTPFWKFPNYSYISEHIVPAIENNTWATQISIIRWVFFNKTFFSGGMEKYVLSNFEKFLKFLTQNFPKNFNWKPCNGGNNLRKKNGGGIWHSQKRGCEWGGRSLGGDNFGFWLSLIKVLRNYKK